MNEKLTRLNQVIQTEATVPTIHDFLLSHVPFENIYSDLTKTKSISEEKLLESLMNTQELNDHKFIIIQGGNGSGKSHLIRWLKEKYVANTIDSKEKVLLISRAHNTIKGALQQIYESDIFPKEMREEQIKRLRGMVSTDTGESLKRQINFAFTEEIILDSSSTDFKINSYLNKLKREYLREFLLNPKIINNFLSVKAGPLNRIMAKIDPTGQVELYNSDEPVFKSSDFNISLKWIKDNLESSQDRASDAVINFAQDLERNNDGFREKVASYLNMKVGNVVRRSIKLPRDDFQQLFFDLRVYLKRIGYQLTLFIEDINSFTGIDEALMEVLLTNHTALGNEKYCRLISVVGSTTAFYNEKLNQSIKDRIEYKYYVAETSVLGTPQKLAQFAAKYINAINTEESQSSLWYRQGANEKSIPIYSDPHQWAHVEINDEKYSIYPFNQNALWNLFSELTPDKRTPREFIKGILKNLLVHWYSNPEKFLLNEDKFKINGSLLTFIKPLDIKINEENGNDSIIPRKLLLCIYGSRPNGSFFDTYGNGVGGVDTQIFKDFGVKINEDLVTTPTKEQAPSSRIPEISTKPAPKVENAKLNEMTEDLKKWNTGKSNMVYHSEMRDILIDFISISVNWNIYGITEYQVAKNLNKNYLSIEGSIIDGVNNFVINRNQETYIFLDALLQWHFSGQKSWFFEDGLTMLVIASTWLFANEKKIILYMTGENQESEQMSKYLVHAQLLGCIYGGRIMGGDLQNDIKNIYKIFTSKIANFPSSENHSYDWSQISKQFAQNNELIFTAFIREFSKSIGSATPGDTPYTFIDAHLILKHLDVLKRNNWDFKKDFITLTPKHTRSMNEAYELVKKHVESEETLIKSETKYVSVPINEVIGWLNNQIEENAIDDTIREIRKFLTFLQEIGTYINSDDYNILSKSGLSKSIVEEISQLKSEVIIKSNIETLALFSTFSAKNSKNFSEMLRKLDTLIKEKENFFSARVNHAVSTSIETKTKKISDIISRISIR